MRCNWQRCHLLRINCQIILECAKLAKKKAEFLTNWQHWQRQQVAAWRVVAGRDGKAGRASLSHAHLLLSHVLLSDLHALHAAATRCDGDGVGSLGGKLLLHAPSTTTSLASAKQQSGISALGTRHSQHQSAPTRGTDFLRLPPPPLGQRCCCCCLWYGCRCGCSFVF